jgi:hypothetical protein
MDKRTIRTPPIVRFHRLYTPEPNSGCWIWIGALSGGAGGEYGYFGRGGREGSMYAHRFSYEHFCGPIPDGFTIDHQCNNKTCVNPDHLKAMTQGDNNRRIFDAISHCPGGHAYADGNMRFKNSLGWVRDCRTCHRNRERERYRNGASR